MKKLKNSLYKKCINEEWYNRIIVWSGLHPSEFNDRIQAITVINPYLGLRCAEECYKREELEPFINRVNSAKLRNVKSANQLISLILVEMKLNDLDSAYSILIRKGKECNRD